MCAVCKSLGWYDNAKATEKDATTPTVRVVAEALTTEQMVESAVRFRQLLAELARVDGERPCCEADTVAWVMTVVRDSALSQTRLKEAGTARARAAGERDAAVQRAELAERDVRGLRRLAEVLTAERDDHARQLREVTAEREESYATLGRVANERDDLARRLSETDASWAQVAAERDEANRQLDALQAAGDLLTGLQASKTLAATLAAARRQPW